jgi:hypothetical protein
MFLRGRAGLLGRPAGQLTRVPRDHGNNRKYAAIQLMFPHEKEFSPKLSAVWAVIFQNFCQPCAAWIKSKEYQF